jgi:hypothetical protein
LASRRRNSTMFRFALAAIALAGAALGPRAALAAGWHYYDPDCPIALGGKTMKFVAMQPKKNIDRVCDALPETGPTVIALDAPDAELREMNWDIRVLRDVGRRDGEEDAEAGAVFRLPVQKFRNGMANFDHNFVGAGKYILFAKMTSDDGAKEYVGRHHFTVGLLDNSEIYAYVFFACFVLALGGGFALTVARRRQSAPGG